MLDAAIIPKNNRARLPSHPALNVRGISDVIVKQLKQSSTFSSIQFYDAADEPRVHIQCFSTRVWMNSHDWMCGVGQLIQSFSATQIQIMANRIMACGQGLDKGLQRRRKRRKRRIHVSEQSIAARTGYDLNSKQ